MSLAPDTGMDVCERFLACPTSFQALVSTGIVQMRVCFEHSPNLICLSTQPLLERLQDSVVVHMGVMAVLQRCGVSVLQAGWSRVFSIAPLVLL